MEKNVSGKFTLVPNERKYWEFIRIHRVEQQKWFLIQGMITFDNQIEYMKKYNDNFYIALLEEEPVGWVGEIDGDVRVCVHPWYNNQGIGLFMLQEMEKLFPDKLHAKIKKENISSIKLFEKTNIPFKLV